MKIKRFIELLQKLPLDDDIEIRDCEWRCWMNIKKIERMKVIERKQTRMFTVWWYYTDEEEDEFKRDFDRLKKEWWDFCLTHKRVIR